MHVVWFSASEHNPCQLIVVSSLTRRTLLTISPFWITWISNASFLLRCTQCIVNSVPVLIVLIINYLCVLSKRVFPIIGKFFPKMGKNEIRDQGLN